MVSGSSADTSDSVRSLSAEELACKDSVLLSQLDSLRYNEQGLIPAIVQDYLDGTVLMMAWMNRESLQKTLETGRTWFWSRSRQALWAKGETSGHVQWVKQIRYDCDGDTLLITVEQVGDVACHTGARSCFFRPLLNSAAFVPPAADTLSQVFAVIKARQADPSPNSYTSSLLAKGDNAILKKLGEETAEVVMAVKDQEPTAIASEVADLWYHCLVALAHHQVDIKDVYRQLQARRSSK
ncbi:MAG: bifunctional phosphoribosyl-AMP cyclohydrolase/phosphoribosyl-ATP diphosphatase HisIE [Thermostichus sp. DG_1_6_bins_120]